MAGSFSGEGGDAGDSSVEELVHLVDAFDDGDTLANDPGGWWYTVNDGAGQQELTIGEDPEHPEVGLCLRTTGSNFESWGAAVGVGIDGFYARGAFDTLRFSARSSAVREVSLQMLGGSEPRFIRTLQVGTEWTEYSIYLDRESVTVDGETVMLDIPSLYELQWFFFVPEPFDFWLDDVRLLRHE